MYKLVDRETCTRVGDRTGGTNLKAMNEISILPLRIVWIRLSFSGGSYLAKASFVGKGMLLVGFLGWSNAYLELTVRIGI